MARGVAVTQSGVPISQAIDSQKVLDSRWKFYEMAFEGFVSSGTIQFGKRLDLYEHNLGFIPAFDCYDTNLGAYVIGDNSGGIRADNRFIYFEGQNANNIDYSSHKLLLRIYNVPIIEEYTAPISQTLPVKSSTKTTQGVKVRQSTADFREQELSRFAMNTQSKTLSVQKTGLVTANSGTNFLAIIQHDLGYPPTFLAAYADFGRQWAASFNPDFIPVRSVSDDKQLVFKGVQSSLIGTFSYVIFKELGDFAL